jgi:hypothetical protein
LTFSEQPESEDVAWLLARMRGEPATHLDPERAASYLRLEAALRALPVPTATPGWQEKVLEALRRRARGVQP